MSFTAEGVFPVVIKAVIPMAEPKFATGEYDFDVAIKVQHRDDAAQEDWWNGEMSQNYGKGAVSHLTQQELTEQTLRKLGWEGDDLMTLEELVNKETTAKVVEKDGYFNVQRLAVGGQVRAVDPEKAAKILAMMGKGKGGAAKAKTAPKQAAAPKQQSDPFGGKPEPEDERDTLPMGDSNKSDVPF